MDRQQGDGPRLGRRRRLLPLAIATASRNVWSYDTRTKALKQQTKFRDFDVKTLDASTSANAVVFEQGGYIHELDPATGRERTRRTSPPTATSRG